jgi:hypothetical protein
MTNNFSIETGFRTEREQTENDQRTDQAGYRCSNPGRRSYVPIAVEEKDPNVQDPDSQKTGGD